MDPADIVAITQVLNHYVHVLDAADWDRLDDVFTADAVLDYRTPTRPDVMHGLAAAKEFFRGANHPSAHHCTNIYVFQDGDQVRVRSKFLVPYTRDTHTPHRWYGGDYDDEVVRTEAGWRISKRTCTGRWQYTTDPEPLPEGRRTW